MGEKGSGHEAVETARCFQAATFNSGSNTTHKTFSALVETEMEVDWAECSILPLQPCAGLKKM